MCKVKWLLLYLGGIDNFLLQNSNSLVRYLYYFYVILVQLVIMVFLLIFFAGINLHPKVRERCFDSYVCDNKCHMASYLAIV